MVDMVKPIRRAGGTRFKARRQSATQRPISPLDHWIQLFLTEIAPFYETKDTFAIKRVQLVAQYIGLGLRPLFVGRKPVLFLHKFLNLGRGGDKHGRELSLRSFDRPFASDWRRADLFQR